MNIKNTYKKKIEKIFLNIFKIKKKNLYQISQDNFYGWDSINHLKLIIELEKELGIKLNIKEQIKIKNYKKLLETLEKKFIQ